MRRRRSGGLCLALADYEMGKLGGYGVSRFGLMIFDDWIRGRGDKIARYQDAGATS